MSGNISVNNNIPATTLATPKETFSSSETKLVVETIVLLVLSLGIVFGNGLVCAAFSTERKLRTTTNCFVVSLACSDLIVGIVIIPVYLATKHRATHYREPLYRVWLALEIIGCSSSILSLVIISMERCLSVKFPAIHRNLTRKHTYTGIVFVWLYAIFVSGALMDFYTGNEIESWMQLYKCIMSFFLPLFVIICSYAIIFRVAIMRTKRHNNKLAREIRIALTISIVVGVFVCCWLPFFVIYIIAAYNAKLLTANINVPLAMSFAKWLQYINSGVNPIIYAYVNQDFRQRFRKLLPCCVWYRRSRLESSLVSRSRAGSHLDSKTETTSLRTTHV